MPIFLRLCQQGLAFLSVQLTLKLYGVEVYHVLNEVLLVYLVALSILQPMLNQIWQRSERMAPDLCMFLGVCVLGALFFLKSIMLACLSFIYIVGRLFERYAYIKLLSNNRFLQGQLFLLVILLIELGLLIMLSDSILVFSDSISVRLALSAVSFLLPSLFVLAQYARQVRIVESRINYFTDIFRRFDVLIYFVLAVLLINCDRKIAPSIVEDAEVYLFSLNVAGAVFGLVSIKIDKVKSVIANGGQVKFCKELTICVAFFMISGLYWIVLQYSFMFREFFALTQMGYFKVFSAFYMTTCVFIVMLVATPSLIRGNVYIYILIMGISLVLKLLLVSVLNTNLFFANYISGSFLLVSLVYLKFRVLKQTFE